MIPALLDEYKNSLEQDISSRETYGYAVFILVIAWLLIIVYIILSVGNKSLALDSRLSCGPYYWGYY